MLIFGKILYFAGSGLVIWRNFQISNYALCLTRVWTQNLKELRGTKRVKTINRMKKMSWVMRNLMLGRPCQIDTEARSMDFYWKTMLQNYPVDGSIAPEDCQHSVGGLFFNASRVAWILNFLPNWRKLSLQRCNELLVKKKMQSVEKCKQSPFHRLKLPVDLNKRWQLIKVYIRKCQTVGPRRGPHEAATWYTTTGRHLT